MSGGIISNDIKRLVIARLQKTPEDMKLSIGKEGSFDKYQLIEEVKKESEVGKQIIEMHLMYLRSFKMRTNNATGFE